MASDTRLIVMLIFMVLFPASCSLKNNNDPLDTVEFRRYIELQENIVDREAYQGGLTKENIDLRLEVNSLNHELLGLTTDNHQYLQELPNPKDRILEDQIRISKNNVMVSVRDAEWSYIVDSNSMDPLLDVGTTVLTVKPASETDIEVGDIIAFRSDSSDISIIHRVYNTGHDDKGVYYTTKGDNNPSVDPDKVRYGDVEAIVVGILY